MSEPTTDTDEYLLNRSRKRGPTSPATHAKHLRAAGWLCIPPYTSLWKRLLLAWRG